jgi:hypothetical protein
MYRFSFALVQACDDALLHTCILVVQEASKVIFKELVALRTCMLKH